MGEWTIGIIGGSGLYAIDALEEPQTIAVDTPWGAPSDALTIGRIAGVKFVFLPRHGPGHRFLAKRSQPARQYRRDEARRLHRPPRHLRDRLVERGDRAGPFRGGRPVHRSHPGPPGQLLRPGHGRPCLACRAGLPAPFRLGRRCGRGGRRDRGPGRLLRRDRGAAILAPAPRAGSIAPGAAT